MKIDCYIALTIDERCDLYNKNKMTPSEGKLMHILGATQYRYVGSGVIRFYFETEEECLLCQLKFL